MEKCLRSGHEAKIGFKKKEAFMEIVQSKHSGCDSYLTTIKGLTPAEAKIGSDWLNEVITVTIEQCLKKAGSVKNK
jgi:hypothetical protein